MAMETEEIGQNVLNNLAQDREKINSARNRFVTQSFDFDILNGNLNVFRLNCILFCVLFSLEI